MSWLDASPGLRVFLVLILIVIGVVLVLAIGPVLILLVVVYVVGRSLLRAPAPAR